MNDQERDALDSFAAARYAEAELLEFVPQPFVNLVALKRSTDETIYINPAQVTWVVERDIGCDVRMIDNTIVKVLGSAAEVVLILRGEL